MDSSSCCKTKQEVCDSLIRTEKEQASQLAPGRVPYHRCIPCAPQPAARKRIASTNGCPKTKRVRFARIRFATDPGCHCRQPLSPLAPVASPSLPRRSSLAVQSTTVTFARASCVCQFAFAAVHSLRTSSFQFRTLINVRSATMALWQGVTPDACAQLS
jgi:hypothetical protein